MLPGEVLAGVPFLVAGARLDGEHCTGVTVDDDIADGAVSGDDWLAEGIIGGDARDKPFPCPGGEVPAGELGPRGDGDVEVRRGGEVRLRVDDTVAAADIDIPPREAGGRAPHGDVVQGVSAYQHAANH